MVPPLVFLNVFVKQFSGLFREIIAASALIFLNSPLNSEQPAKQISYEKSHVSIKCFASF